MSQKYVLFIISSLIFLLFFFLFFIRSQSIRSLFGRDEYHWVGRGYFFDLLIKKNLSPLYWDTYGVNADPKLPTYIYGLLLYPQYLRESHGKNKDFIEFLIDHNVFEKQYMNQEMKSSYAPYIRKNKSYIPLTPAQVGGQRLTTLLEKYGPGFRKTMSIFLTARLASVFFTALSMVIIFFISLEVLKRLKESIFVTLLTGVSNVFVIAGSRAYADGMFMFFFACGVLLLIHIFSARKSSVTMHIFFGIIVAFSNQVKFNGVMLLIFYNFLYFLEFCRNFKLHSFRFKDIRHILIANFSFLIFFILLDPYLYRHTLRNLIDLYVSTAKSFELLPPSFGPHLTTVSERIYFMFRFLFTEKSVLAPIVFARFSFVTLGFSFIAMIFFFVGYGYVFLILVNEMKSFFSRKNQMLSPMSIIFIIFNCSLVLLSLYLLFEQGRYLIHLIPFIFIFILYACRRILKRFLKVL